MSDLLNLIKVWLKQHPVLSKHFDAEPVRAIPPHGQIKFLCVNSCYDEVAQIWDHKVNWYAKEVHAANPELFKKLEEYLIIYHDRRSVTNIIMFRDHCGDKLHACPAEGSKTFCTC